MLSRCRLWTEPEAMLAKPLAAVFRVVEVFADESHWWRYLIECRTCGQLYVFEFFDEIDWSLGDDPRYTTYVPVGSRAEVDELLQAPRGQLHSSGPELRADRPSGKPETIRWFGREDRNGSPE
ncbi:MAG: hypothetical protein KDE35_04415 [Geminicoccaceae bacterium]|nr:hypothetical protein [Geminicoccaceae bacterium]